MKNKEAKTKRPKEAKVEKKTRTPESRVEARKRSEVPLFLRKSPSSPQGNSQDLKDKTPE
jgi:hypothetical protein